MDGDRYRYTGDEKFLTALHDSLSEMEVFLQNTRGLELFFLWQGRLYTALDENLISMLITL